MRRVVRHSLLVFALLAAGTAAPASALETTKSSCHFSASDQAWVDRSMAAWRLTVRDITHVRVPTEVTAVLFSADCAMSSADAMGAEGPISWNAVAHDGTVELPGGDTLTASVTSYAGQAATGAYFVMSTPSVWAAGGVPGGPMGLETLMTAVLVHEGTHIAQSGTYMRQFSEIAETAALPETFNDDGIQERFEGDADFSASVARETDLLFAAGAAPDHSEAKVLAAEALAMIKARRARYYVGTDAFLAHTEDVFLTLEGSGQWAGYQWLTHPEGGGVDAVQAIVAFGRRGRWWSQLQGLGLALATDRLDGGVWRAVAFGEGQSAGIALLENALNEAGGISPPP